MNRYLKKVVDGYVNSYSKELKFIKRYIIDYLTVSALSKHMPEELTFEPCKGNTGVYENPKNNWYLDEYRGNKSDIKMMSAILNKLGFTSCVSYKDDSIVISISVDIDIDTILDQLNKVSTKI